MLIVYDVEHGGLKRREGEPAIGERTVWMDLLNPTPEEDRIVEQALGIEIPTREEMQEIEVSSRLYQEDGAHFMTATIVSQLDTDRPLASAMTFILAGDRLVTVRYIEPKAFALFLQRAQKPGSGSSSGTAVLIGLLEVIIDRLADALERIQADVDALARDIFQPSETPRTAQRRFDEILRRVGREGDLTSRVRESLASLARLFTYFAAAVETGKGQRELRARIRTAALDAASLSDHVSYIAGKVAFLLEATLGMVNIEQNSIIKIFSVAAVVFLPPTLIASIYGMNFEFIPEFKLYLGYPLALMLMVVSAILPYLYFKRRGWL